MLQVTKPLQTSKCTCEFFSCYQHFWQFFPCARKNKTLSGQRVQYQQYFYWGLHVFMWNGWGFNMHLFKGLAKFTLTSVLWSFSRSFRFVWNSMHLKTHFIILECAYLYRQLLYLWKMLKCVILSSLYKFRHDLQMVP